MSANDAIEVQCPQCNSDFRVKAKAIGKTVKCPKCQFSLLIEPPVPSDNDDLPQPSDIGLDFLANPPKQSSSEPPPLSPPLITTIAEPAFQESPSPSFNVNATPRKASLIVRRYRALEIVRVLLYCMAILVAVGWLLWTVGTMLGAAGIIATASTAPSGQWPADVPTGVSPFSEDLTDAQREAIMEYQTQNMAPAAAGFAATFGLVMWLSVTFSSVFTIVVLCSYAELIKVALDIQENTQRSAHYLAQR